MAHKDLPEFSTTAHVSFLDDDVDEPVSAQALPESAVAAAAAAAVATTGAAPRPAGAGKRGGRRGDRGNEAPQERLAPDVVPDPVRLWALQLQRGIAERLPGDVQSCYDDGFNKLTDKFFKQQPWPLPEAVVRHLDASVGAVEQFALLYREMYYRHIYGRLQPTPEQRVASWANYCELLDALAAAADGEELPLPAQWLWDITDEFVYQFQAFSQYRAKVKGKTPEEVALIAANASAWSVQTVVAYLHKLIAHGRLSSEAAAAAAASQPEQQQPQPQQSSVNQTLGSFALIGLARVHCLLADYTGVLRVLEPVDLLHKGVLAQVTACHVTLYYYLGFAYLMLRRYADAVKTFAAILVFLSRAKQYNSRSYQFDAVNKKSDQMYALLAIAVTLSPQRVDEHVHNILREKHSDRMARMMQKSDSEAYEELFQFACPKFVLACAPKLLGPEATEEEQQAAAQTNYAIEPLRQQQRLFIREVQQQKMLSTLRSYLKLYTSIPLPKLASFLDMDVEAVRTQLACFKHKTRSLMWQSGPVAEGRWGTTGDVDFYVDGDMVHMREVKVTRRYADFFLRHMNKFVSIA
eukprot:m51a1_g10551 putative eukaryotic translation initiation factor 3 subunit l-like (579) ;mRNA; r:38355-40527